MTNRRKKKRKTSYEQKQRQTSQRLPMKEALKWETGKKISSSHGRIQFTYALSVHTLLQVCIRVWVSEWVNEWSVAPSKQTRFFPLDTCICTSSFAYLHSRDRFSSPHTLLFFQMYGIYAISITEKMPKKILFYFLLSNRFIQLPSWKSHCVCFNLCTHVRMCSHAYALAASQ